VGGLLVNLLKAYNQFHFPTYSAMKGRTVRLKEIKGFPEKSALPSSSQPVGFSDQSKPPVQAFVAESSIKE